MKKSPLAGAIAGTALLAGLLVVAPADAAAAARTDVRPERTVKPQRVGVKYPSGIHLATSGRLYVVHDKRPQLLVYGAGARSRSRPLYRIAGSRTGLADPSDVARDSGGRLYVSNGNGRILVFGKRARGNVRPIRVINAGMRVGSIAVRGQRVVVDGSAGVKVFRRTASGAAVPLQHLAGDKTMLEYAMDVGVNVDGRIWAVYGEAEIVTVHAPGATGNVAPERVVEDQGPDIWEPEQISFDRAGRVYLGDHDGTVAVFRADFTTVSPLRTIGEAWQSHVDGLSVSRTGKVAVGSSRGVRIFPRFMTFTPPWAVRSVTVSGSPGSTSRVVRWRAPAADGGTAITRFRVVVKQGDRVVKVARLRANRRSYVLRRAALPAGESTVVVRAKNRKGYGPAVTVPITVTHS